jgi:hypothetical protein
MAMRRIFNPRDPDYKRKPPPYEPEFSTGERLRPSLALQSILECQSPEGSFDPIGLAREATRGDVWLDRARPNLEAMQAKAGSIQEECKAAACVDEVVTTAAVILLLRAEYKEENRYWREAVINAMKWLGRTICTTEYQLDRYLNP